MKKIITSLTFAFVLTALVSVGNVSAQSVGATSTGSVNVGTSTKTTTTTTTPAVITTTNVTTTSTSGGIGLPNTGKATEGMEQIFYFILALSSVTLGAYMVTRKIIER